MQSRKSLIELPGKGKALVVTDIHGNLADFERYMEIWNDFKRRENHLILTGDYIHSMSGVEDCSMEILGEAMELYNEEGVHLLLGNHEWSHIAGEDVYKAGVNQTLEFESHVEEKFGEEWEHQLDLYINFFKKLPLAARTENGVFISHAAPARNIGGIEDMINITGGGYGMDNDNLFDLLWSRYPQDYDEKDIDVFLEKVGCKVSVVGHTPVDGYMVIGNQIVLSSSFSAGRKAYIRLDLEKEIKDVDDVIGMIEYLE